MKPNDDSAQFLALVEKHRDMIWQVCSNYSLSAAWTVEDAFQEVIVVLWRDYRRFKGCSSDRTWVYRVATNVMLMLKRKMGNRPQPDIPDGEETAGDDENYHHLLQLIESLDGMEYRIVKAHLDGFSYAEIAGMLQLTVPAVAMRLMRAKQKLKHQYEYEKGF